MLEVEKKLPIEVSTNDIYRAASLMFSGAVLSSVDDFSDRRDYTVTKPVFELLLAPTYNSNNLRTFKDFLKFLYFDLKLRYPECRKFHFQDEAGIYTVDSTSAYVKVFRPDSVVGH